jgi:hypothetical protein
MLRGEKNTAGSSIFFASQHHCASKAQVVAQWCCEAKKLNSIILLSICFASQHYYAIPAAGGMGQRNGAIYCLPLAAPYLLPPPHSTIVLLLWVLGAQ